MRGLRKPGLRDGIEVLLGHSCVSRGEELRNRLLAEAVQRLEIVLEECFVWLALFQRSIFCCESLDAIDQEKDLRLQRLLTPQRAVVVERRDARGRRNMVPSAFLRHPCHEVEDGRPHGTFAPGW